MSLAYVLACRLFALAVLLGRGDRSKELEILVLRHELSIPPRVSFEQVKGFGLWAARSVFSGAGDDVIDVAGSNLRQLALE